MRTKTQSLAMTLVLAALLGPLATMTQAQVITENQGRLKVCKVAGPGVPVGTLFTFKADNKPSFTVPAGPWPGGYCVVGPTFPVGSIIPVVETLTNGNQVTNIDVNPPGRLVPGSINLSGGSVNIQIGSGVTEVTFTNKRTGFIEICKQTKPLGGAGNYQFYVNPGWLGPYTVPAGSCSPAIEVPAGMVDIYEVLYPGVQLVGCSTLPPGMQGPCNAAAGVSTVNVAPGDVSTQTIVFMTNSSKHDGTIDDPTDDVNSTEAGEDPQPR